MDNSKRHREIAYFGGLSALALAAVVSGLASHGCARHTVDTKAVASTNKSRSELGTSSHAPPAADQW